MNCQLSQATKFRGHFPPDAAAVKFLRLGICNIADKRARERFKDARKKGRTPRRRRVRIWLKVLEPVAGSRSCGSC